MRIVFWFHLIAAVICAETTTAKVTLPASLPGGLGTCYTPVETYPYKLNKSDPLYETSLQDHQRYLDEMEDYVNCLDRERGQALDELRASFDLFIENFGKDAVLKYAAENPSSHNQHGTLNSKKR